jgi:hypothetical protein
VTHICAGLLSIVKISLDSLNKIYNYWCSLYSYLQYCGIIQQIFKLRYKITKQEEIKVSYIRVNVESLTKLKDIIRAPRSVDFPAKFQDQMNKTFDLAYGNDRGASALIAGRSRDLIHAELWYGIAKRSKPFDIRHWMGEAAIVFRQAEDDTDLTNFETCDWA